MKNITIRTQDIVIITTVIIAGIFFLSASRNFSDQGKYVEVKGLSERIVKADRGIWSIGIDVKSNDIDDLYKQIDTNTSTIKSFLIKQGFQEEEFNVAPINVYQDTYRDSVFRYNASVQMSVYTDKVDLLRTSSENTASLIQNGVIFNNSYIEFEFTDLNSIKSDMLAEAIANGKEAAEKFAEDSDASLGDLARANQGVFSITNKDQASPEYKNVRVVSTLRYILK